MKGLKTVLKVAIFSVFLHNALNYIRDHTLIKKERQRLSETIIDMIPKGEIVSCFNPSRFPPKQISHNEFQVCNFRNMCYSRYNKRFFIHVDDGEIPLKFSTRDINKYHQIFVPVHLTSAMGIVDKFFFHKMPTRLLETPEYSSKYYRHGKYVMFCRISSNNIAHDIHDVLLPLFYTLDYDELFPEPIRTHLCMFNDNSIEDGHELYRILSKEEPILQTDLQLLPSDTVVCFEDLTVGLTNSTTWYDWGVGRIPERPINGSSVTAKEIKEFASYVQSKLGIHRSCLEGEEYGVLFSRKKTRRIINELELAKTLSEELHMDVLEVSLQRNTLREIIEKVSCARFAIGMHGAILIMSMFLPTSSVLLEMFPYAINPDNQRTYKEMVRLPGMEIEYLTWRNLNASKSILSAKRYDIDHLSEEEQQIIRSRTEVPPKVCCNDPEWKFRMYHDTVVDIKAVVNILRPSVALI